MLVSSILLSQLEDDTRIKRLEKEESPCRQNISLKDARVRVATLIQPFSANSDSDSGKKS